ncbi:PQQ-binding-like beta-propeller repeat protein, partial [bacterium]|nr:PQQ-binding-like beta-propeller repeat protein [bacterium]
MTKLRFAFFLLLIGVLGKFLLDNFNRLPSTPSKWSISLGKEILTPPVNVGDEAFFVVGGSDLSKINEKGNITGPINLQSTLRHPLIPLINSVVVSDTEGRILSFRKSDLKLMWERQVPEAPSISPISLPDGNILVAVSSGALFSLDGQSGNPTWECYVTGAAMELSA